MSQISDNTKKAVFVYGSQQLAIDQYVQFHRFCEGYPGGIKHQLFLAKNKEPDVDLE